MNQQHLEAIADQLQFKLTMRPAQRIPSGPGGGHLCWKVASDTETFFIKQLDPALNVNDRKVIARYELCESVAARFAQQGINAVYAVRNNDKSVIVIENSAYLVYPFIDGYAFNEITSDHALKIAETLAKIHIINLDVPEIEPKWDIHSNDEILSSFEKARSYDKSLLDTLKKKQDIALSMNDRYLSAIPILKESTVVTHGDIFPHNVIWQTPDQPFLIDWEAVKKWNPTREAIRTCVAWSKIGDEPHSTSVFENMLKTYINHNAPFEKKHAEAALNGIYGSIINWLLYNIALVCGKDDTRKEDAAKEILRSIESGEKLNKLYPMIFNSIKKIT